MRGNLTALERAFELAATGKFSDVRAIKQQLRDEDYPAADHSLFGPSLRLQLQKAIASAYQRLTRSSG